VASRHDDDFPGGCFSFRLYAEHVKGSSLDQMATRHGISSASVAERIELARVCVEKKTRIETDPQFVAVFGEKPTNAGRLFSNLNIHW
jgi:hypothetical protein